MTNPLRGKWEVIPDTRESQCGHSERFRIAGALNGCLACQCEEEARLKRVAREEIKELRKSVKPTSVYAVGSREHGKIIFDFISSNREQALAYCESRENERYVWEVWKVSLGEQFFSWRYIHTTKKCE